MTRASKSRSMLACILVLAAAATAPAVATAAEPSAVEEYVLTLPGVDTSNVGQSQPLADLAKRAGPVGVTGERREPETALSAIGETLPTVPGLVLIAALATGIGLAARRRGLR